jgi:glyoxylase-like metal-dependent hydrolase (beta-lactamase superfamily II)
MHSDECLHTMRAGLKKLDIDLKKTDFFITHFHMDHFGLVSRLVHDGSIVYMNELETSMIQKIKSDAFFSEIRDFIRMSGFTEQDPGRILPPRLDHESKAKTPLSFQFVEDADIIERGEYRFICVKTPGHSKGHMCLYEPDNKILIAGDHLLKDITPAIHGRVNNENPLKEYLSSLDKVYALDVEVVLPGHRNYFRNCRERIVEIQDHHRQRNHEVISILQEGARNIYEVASRMTWNTDCDSWDSLPVSQSFFAVAEAFAHLRYLEEKGEIEMKMEGEVAIYSLGETYQSSRKHSMHGQPVVR